MTRYFTTSSFVVMSSSSKSETVPVRLPKTLWQQVRLRALERGESGLAYLARSVETALGSDARALALHGLPEAVGTSEDVPLTHRSEYLGQAREAGLTHAARVRVPPQAAADPWSAPCARAGCGHPKRAHLHQGAVGRCGFGDGCACRGFEAPTAIPAAAASGAGA